MTERERIENDNELRETAWDDALDDVSGLLPPVVNLDFREKEPKTHGFRRPITFVKEQSGGLLLDTSIKPSIGTDYLSLVLPKTSSNDTKSGPAICAVCKLPLVDEDGKVSKAHEASLAHQVCVAHKHPPSALDRSRKGLTYLQSYGWDPDARRGLGAAGEGMLHPISVKEKKGKAGIGSAVPKPSKRAEQPKEKLLNAKQIRRQGVEDRKKREKLERMLFSNDELDKYLGEDA
jgi:hypothetical protein